MPTLVLQNPPTGPWDFPPGTRRYYRLQVLVVDALPTNVDLTVTFASSSGATMTQLAWRYPEVPPFTYQVGAGPLTVNTGSSGIIVSLYVEVETPGAATAGTPQDAMITVTGTVGPSSASCHLNLVGHVGEPEDMRAAISVVLDQTLGDASIDMLGSAKDAANSLVDLLRPDDWANCYRLPVGGNPKLPSENDFIKPMNGATSTNRNRVHTVINGTPDSTLGQIRADFGINLPAKTLQNETNSCACAPLKRAVILLAGSGSMGAELIKVQTTVTRYAIWLGTPPSDPPDGSYSQFNVSNPNVPDGLFLLTKYLMQALAVSTGSNVLSDPQGTLLGKQTVEIPFDVTDADYDLRVVVLTDRPDLLKVNLHVDDGRVVPGQTRGASRRRGHRFVEFTVARKELNGGQHSTGCGCGAEAHHKPDKDELPPPKSGAWKAVLSLAQRDDEEDDTTPVQYSLVVMGQSRVQFVANVSQDSDGIGGSAFISARLEDSGLGISGDRAQVWAEVTYPDGGTSTVRVPEIAEGRFEARVTLTQPGTTKFRVMAAGKRLPKGRFQREQTFNTITRGFSRCSSKCGHRGASKVEDERLQAPAPVVAELSNAVVAAESTGANPAADGGSRRRSLAERVISAVAQELLR